MTAPSVPIALALGLALGVRHAVDPDHLAAVLALSQSERRTGRVLVSALAWALGHSFTFLACGFAVVAFGLSPPAGFDEAVTLVVGCSLVLVGGLAVWRLARPADLCRVSGDRSGRLRRRAFAIGGIHGLAGSHAVALLALTTLRDPRIAAAHLCLFCLGTVIGMGVIAFLLSRSLAWAAASGPMVVAAIGALAGSASVILGLLLVGEAFEGWA